MSTERDELRDLLQANMHRIEGFERWTFQAPVDMADALLAAGYRKPQQVTTLEELDALPFETVIRDSGGHVLERWGEPEEKLWATVMVNAFIPCSDIAFPVTVLHVGGAE